MAPVDEEYVPALQLEHPDDADDDEYVPDVQSVHDDEPAEDHEPASHMLHVDAPLLE